MNVGLQEFFKKAAADKHNIKDILDNNVHVAERIDAQLLRLDHLTYTCRNVSIHKETVLEVAHGDMRTFPINTTVKLNAEVYNINHIALEYLMNKQRSVDILYKFHSGSYMYSGKCNIREATNCVDINGVDWAYIEAYITAIDIKENK